MLSKLINAISQFILYTRTKIIKFFLAVLHKNFLPLSQLLTFFLILKGLCQAAATVFIQHFHPSLQWNNHPIQEGLNPQEASVLLYLGQNIGFHLCKITYLPQLWIFILSQISRLKMYWYKGQIAPILLEIASKLAELVANSLNSLPLGHFIPQPLHIQRTHLLRNAQLNINNTQYWLSQPAQLCQIFCFLLLYTIVGNQKQNQIRALGCL